LLFIAYPENFVPGGTAGLPSPSKVKQKPEPFSMWVFREKNRLVLEPAG
jgi:hypothetical protein